MVITSKRRDSWFLGIDLGTSGCKSIIVDEQAQILGLGSRDYDAPDARSRWQEQDPQSLIEGMIASVSAALEQANVAPAACSGISLGGALHGIMALDDEDQPLTPLITWADGRAAQQAEAVRADHALATILYRETGCPVHASFPLYKLIWLREEQPRTFARAARFVSAKEYAVAYLAGDYAVDFCMAAGTALLNTHSLHWNPRSLELAQISSEQLSRLEPPGTSFPQLRERAARELGLPDTTPLVLGSADAANSSLGAGAVGPGQATCMVATSGALRLVTTEPVLDAQGQIWSYAIDGQHWLVGGAINNGGVALAWLLDTVNELLPAAHHRTFDDLLAQAQTAEPGAEGLLCLPFFSGERSPDWNVNARGVFFGLTLRHNAGHLARAVLEGIAFRLRSIMDMLNAAGLNASEIRVSGGFTQSDFWLQLMADVLRRELMLPKQRKTSALGAAFWAMHGAGLIDGLQDAHRFVPVSRSVAPRNDAAAIYDHLYATYGQLYQSLDGAFDQVAALQAKLMQAD